MDQSEAKFVKEELKKILKQYRVMTAAIKSKLNALGFTVQMAGKHFKIYYKDDWSHCAVISSTSSDVKAGTNVALQVFRALIAPRVIA